MNELTLKYLVQQDNERAALMHVLTGALSWTKEDISRIYDFKTEKLKLEQIDDYLCWASRGEERCIKLAVVLYNGGYYFNANDVRLTELLSGLDSKHFSACMEAIEVRFNHFDRIVELDQKRKDDKRRQNIINER